MLGYHLFRFARWLREFLWGVLEAHPLPSATFAGACAIGLIVWGYYVHKERPSWQR